MSLKGHTFTGADIPKRFQTRWTPEKKAAYLQAQNERYMAVAMDGKTPIIAEELTQRILNKLSSKAKRLAGAMMNADPEVRKEILRAFDMRDGSLLNPFTTV